MKSIQSSIVGVVLCLAGCTGQGDIDDVGSVTEGATSTHHSVQNGASASASGGDGFSSWYVSAWEDGAYGAYVSFYSSTVDPASEVCVTEEYPPRCPPDDPMCCPPDDPSCGAFSYTYCYYTRWTYEYAYGAIDGNDFRASRNGARLRTSLDPSTGIYYERCTFDRLAGTGECTTGAGTDLTVTWARDGMYSAFHQGITESQWGPFTHRTNGRWTFASATVAGSIGGREIASGGDPWMRGGSISEGRSVSHDLIRN